MYMEQKSQTPDGVTKKKRKIPGARDGGGRSWSIGGDDPIAHATPLDSGEIEDVSGPTTSGGV